MATLLLVEDHTMFRAGIRALIERSGAGHIIVGEAADGLAAARLAQQENPDVVLMDIKLPGMSGIQCVAEIKKTKPAMQIIMVTIYEDSERIFRALKAGANGYLVKSSPPEQLLEAIRDAYRGGAPMSSPIARKVVQHFHLLGPSVDETQNLSPRERQVLDLLAMGFIYKEIGSKLDIGTETVRTYVKNICQKMHVRGRLEAVARHRLESH